MVKPKRCLLGTLIYIVALLFLLFLVIFVIIPIIFKYSPEIQRAIIFPTWIAGKQNYSDIKSYGLQGVRNFYVTVDEADNVTLGIWQILPKELLSDLVDNEHYDYEGILANEKYNILLYLHGNGGVRSVPLELYAILRNYFHVVAPDYRGYADSTQAELTEDNIVSDIVNLYKWIRKNTKARIFFWGHSLGTGISTHAISNLKAENIVPSGLVLETPFSSVVDVIERHHIIKLFSWLPWYRATLINPVIDNGFGFESTKYIVDVDSPIMILHAKDDDVVPYDLAIKLYETVLNNRNMSFQGNVTFHLFDALCYRHMDLFLAPELPSYISDFIDVCLEFENKTKNVIEN